MKPFKFVKISGILFLTLFLVNFGWIYAQTESESKNFNKANIADNSEVNTAAVDPKALDLLRRGLDYLSNLKQFSVQAQSTFEDMLDSGHRVDYEISGSVLVNRPNKLRTERYGEKLHQIFYYNGESLTIYNADEKVFATTPAPGTIEEMFFFARDTLGISEPVSDLLYPNSFSLLTQNVNFAKVIGKEMIGDIQCDHLVFSCPGADFQIWIAVNEPHVPYRYVVTDTSTPKLLSFISVMRNWNIKPTLSDDTFNFSPPQEAKKINFIIDKPNNQ